MMIPEERAIQIQKYSNTNATDNIYLGKGRLWSKATSPKGSRSYYLKEPCTVLYVNESSPLKT